MLVNDEGLPSDLTAFEIRRIARQQMDLARNDKSKCFINCNAAIDCSSITE